MIRVGTTAPFEGTVWDPVIRPATPEWLTTFSQLNQPEES